MLISKNSVEEENFMVIINMQGRLGNQMFQYAAGRRLAHTLKTELKINFLLPKKIYKLNAFNIQENFATPEEIAAVKLVRYEGGGIK